MNLWPVLTGDALAKRSRPLFIDSEGNLVVAVSEAAVGQELSLLKPQIVARLRAAGQRLAVTVKGLRFDLQHFHAEEKRSQSPDVHCQAAALLPLAKVPTESDLASVTLNESDLYQLAELKESLKSYMPTSADGQERAMSDRIFALFEREVRTKRFLIVSGCPLCPGCENPVSHPHGPERLCSYCFFVSKLG